MPSPLTVRYRNKLSLPVRGKRGRVKIGMYRRGSHTVVDSDDCLLGNGVFADVVNIFRSYLNDCGAQPYDEKTFGGEVRHLVARYVDGQLLLTVVSNGKWRHDLSPLYERLKKKFPQTGIFINENNLRNNVIMDKKTLHVCGIEYIKGVHAGRALPPWRGQLLSGERRRKGYSLSKGKAIAARCGHAGADRLFFRHRRAYQCSCRPKLPYLRRGDSAAGGAGRKCHVEACQWQGYQRVRRRQRGAAAAGKGARGQKKCVWWWIRRAKAWAKRCAKQ